MSTPAPDRWNRWKLSLSSGTSLRTISRYGPGGISVPGALDVRMRVPFPSTTSSAPPRFTSSVSDGAAARVPWAPSAAAGASSATRTAGARRRGEVTFSSFGTHRGYTGPGYVRRRARPYVVSEGGGARPGRGPGCRCRRGRAPGRGAAHDRRTALPVPARRDRDEGGEESPVARPGQPGARPDHGDAAERGDRQAHGAPCVGEVRR